jgi:hypothetical protein
MSSLIRFKSALAQTIPHARQRVPSDETSALVKDEYFQKGTFAPSGWTPSALKNAGITVDAWQKGQVVGFIALEMDQDPDFKRNFTTGSLPDPRFQAANTGFCVLGGLARWSSLERSFVFHQGRIGFAARLQPRTLAVEEIRFVRNQLLGLTYVALAPNPSASETKGGVGFQPDFSPKALPPWRQRRCETHCSFRINVAADHAVPATKRTGKLAHNFREQEIWIVVTINSKASVGKRTERSMGSFTNERANHNSTAPVENVTSLRLAGVIGTHAAAPGADNFSRLPRSMSRSVWSAAISHRNRRFLTRPHTHNRPQFKSGAKPGPDAAHLRRFPV